MKQDSNNHKEALQFYKNTVQKIRNQQKYDPLIVLSQVNNKAQTHHLAILVLLHHKNFLLDLFQSIQTQYQKNTEKKNKIIQQIQIVLALGLSSFFKYQKNYEKFMNFFQKKVDKRNISQLEISMKKKNKRFQVFSHFYQQFNQIKISNQQNYAKNEELNILVQKLRQQIPLNAYQEPLFTYLRISIQKLHHSIIRQLDQIHYGLCCRLHFQKDSEEQKLQTLRENFHKFLNVKDSSKQKQDFTIHKQIVSYLNSYGGICYIGIDLSPTKIAYIYGTPIDEKQRKQMLQIILLKIVRKIFPDDNENDEEDDKQEQERIDKQFQKKKKMLQKTNLTEARFSYELTKHISVDFINLYDPENLFYARLNQAVIYVVRIKVKKGDQFEVYHYVNSHDIPKAYQRQDKKEKQLSMTQYYDLMYLKLKNKKEKKYEQNKRVYFHPLCRFKNYPEKDKKI